MKNNVVKVFLLGVAALVADAACAQASVYGSVSTSQLTNLISTQYLIGATTGFLLDGPLILHRVLLVGDVQGRFVHKHGYSFDGLTVGPRFELPLKRARLTPYAEFMVGFARYTSTITNISGPTTDSTFQVNAGVTKQLTSHWDATLDYSYSQYYAMDGEFNPKTYSVGAIYSFARR